MGCAQAAVLRYGCWEVLDCAVLCCAVLWRRYRRPRAAVLAMLCMMCSAAAAPQGALLTVTKAELCPPLDELLAELALAPSEPGADVAGPAGARAADVAGAAVDGAGGAGAAAAPAAPAPGGAEGAAERGGGGEGEAQGGSSAPGEAPRDSQESRGGKGAEGSGDPVDAVVDAMLASVVEQIEATGEEFFFVHFPSPVH